MTASPHASTIKLICWFKHGVFICNHPFMFMCTRGFKHQWGEIRFKHFGTSGSNIYFSYEYVHKPERLIHFHTNKTKCPQWPL